MSEVNEDEAAMGIRFQTEAEEVEFCVNLYWQKHYQYYKDGSCKICWGNGVFDTDPSTGTGPHYCICPEGVKMRREKIK